MITAYAPTTFITHSLECIWLQNKTGALVQKFVITKTCVTTTIAVLS